MDANENASTLRSQRATSFLIRFWLEPRENEGQQPAARGYIRNLRSGQEDYLTDVERLPDLVMRHLRADLGSEIQTGASRKTG